MQQQAKKQKQDHLPDSESSMSEHKYDYDLIVIGGGSGGLAAVKEAKKLKPDLKVAVFDYVVPTPHGISWKLGGTCVNVGCIPKKLMHYAGLMKPLFEDAHALGWEITNTNKHNWGTMVSAIDNYIRSLNYAFTLQLKSAGINYINALATFVDTHTVTYTLRGKDHRISAAKFIIAVGGRPRYPDIPGAKLAISSDDIFWRTTAPGKTLVVGGSYIALECAGFLHELGYDVSVMVRSILLRGFDRQVSEQIGEVMERDGVRFISPAIPSKLERANENGPITVTYVVNGETRHEEFDTVLMAIGRSPCTNIGLAQIGVKMDSEGYILVDDAEHTSLEHIYAVGDVIASPENATKRPELTPVAIQAGQYLARRLYANSTKKMDYNLVPTAVFSPIEYGACGMSQEEAEKKLGPENVEVFVSRYNTLESAPAQHEYKAPRSTVFLDNNLWAKHNADKLKQEWKDFEAGSYEHQDRAMQYNHNKCLAKLVCDKKRNNLVVGFHYLGPSAGEVTQGFALAMRYGATKDGFDDLVGIHPTVAEEFTVLNTRQTDNFMKKEGCGGGGSCG